MKKLALLDIDGTLIRAVRAMDNLQRFRYAIQKVYGVDVGEFTKERWDKGKYNGMGDRYILWDLVKPYNVHRDRFVDTIGDIGEAFVEYLDALRPGGPSYEIIEGAREFVDAVVSSPNVSEGILTGNLIQSAMWKLSSVGLPQIAFGVYGHEADHRNDLARLVPPKAKAYFGEDVAVGDIVVIGDTVHDVACARAIGAKVVIVSTGWNVQKSEFDTAKPDLLVDSLMDERVFELLGLP